MPHILIIHNPISGGDGSSLMVKRTANRLKKLGYGVSYYATQSAGDATRYLREFEGVLDIVAAAGGDGLIGEVVNGLSERGGDEYRLAIIPTGTTNVLARELGIKFSSRFAARTIHGGKLKPIYPAQINGRRFMLMAGVGFDAWVVSGVNLKIKKNWGKVAYVLAMLRHLKLIGSKQYEVIADGQTLLADSVMVCNGRFYGGSYKLSEHADLSSSSLQVMTLSGISQLGFMLRLLVLPYGVFARTPGVHELRATSVTIRDLNPSAHPEPVQADGDAVGFLPLEITSATQAIRVMVP
jgi:YegS/Rv2252/BmrU family lipid kinase